MSFKVFKEDYIRHNDLINKGLFKIRIDTRDIQKTLLKIDGVDWHERTRYIDAIEYGNEKYAFFIIADNMRDLHMRVAELDWIYTASNRSLHATAEVMGINHAGFTQTQLIKAIGAKLLPAIYN